jgi:hypothetical protein
VVLTVPVADAMIAVGINFRIIAHSSFDHGVNHFSAVFAVDYAIYATGY